MTFQEALQKLDIIDYQERIFNSHSNGESIHLGDYAVIATELGKIDQIDMFRQWFVRLVEMAEKEWSRPESIFQHVPEFLADS